MKASEYYGLDMYSDKGYYIGEVQEVMLDLDEGEVAGLVFERQGESNKMIPYGNVMAIGEIIIVTSGEKKTATSTSPKKTVEQTGESGEESGESERLLEL